MRTKRELIAAFVRVQRIETQCYRDLKKIREESALRCKVKLGDIVETNYHDGRKRWGYVVSVDGVGFPLRAGWRVYMRNVRKNGTFIGGRFYFSDNDAKQWTVIRSAK